MPPWIGRTMSKSMPRAFQKFSTFDISVLFCDTFGCLVVWQQYPLSLLETVGLVRFELEWRECQGEEKEESEQMERPSLLSTIMVGEGGRVYWQHGQFMETTRVIVVQLKSVQWQWQSIKLCLPPYIIRKGLKKENSPTSLAVSICEKILYKMVK